MTHQFRPRKSDGSGGRRRGRNREGLPRQDSASDLELLPEIDYNHFDQMTPTELAKAAKAVKMPATLLTTMPKNKFLEQLLAAVNQDKDALYAKGILEV